MSQSLSKKEAQQQQVQEQKQYAKDTVTDEKHASAQGSVCIYQLASANALLFLFQFHYLSPILTPQIVNTTRVL